MKRNLVLTIIAIGCVFDCGIAVAMDSLASSCSPEVAIVQNGPYRSVPGSEINFHIVLKNTGCTDARAINVSDTLPSGMKFRSAHPLPKSVPSGGSAGGEVLWENITVPAMSSISIDMTANVQAQTGELINTACSTGPEPDTQVCAVASLVLTDDTLNGEHGYCGANGDAANGGDHHHHHGHGGGAGTCSCPHGRACVMEVTHACDLTMTSEQLPPRSMIRLVGESIHECTPRTGEGGELLSGDGITIEADNVTLDLNGRRLRSAFNASTASGAGANTTNTGIRVAARNVLITNSQKDKTSAIEGFTTNVDFSHTVGGTLRGVALGAEEFNLEVGNNHGGAVIAEGAQSLQVSSVKISSTNPDSGSAVRFEYGSDFELRESWIEGMNGAVELQNASDARILGNLSIQGHKDSGILLQRSVKRVMIAGNTIEKNRLDGIRVGRDSSSVRIESNLIRYNWGYGLRISARGCSDVAGSFNSFSLNAEGDMNDEWIEGLK